MNSNPKSPHPIDLHVGARVRMRRKFVGMSQGALGEGVDLTFQQLQKYERGTNRISASKLHRISKVLNCPVAYFFEGLPGNDDTHDELEAETTTHAFLMTSEGLALAEAFPRIASHKWRRKILDLVRTVAEDDDSAGTIEK